MKKGTNMILLIGLLAMLIYLFTQPIKSPVDVAPYLKQLEALLVQNDSLRLANSSLDDQLEGLKTEADSLAKLVLNDQKIINHLKTKVHEKLKAIDGYDHHELLRFFAGLNTDSTALRR